MQALSAHILTRRCLCGSSKCHGFLGGHSKLAHNAPYWQDADGLEYLVSNPCSGLCRSSLPMLGLLLVCWARVDASTGRMPIDGLPSPAETGMPFWCVTFLMGCNREMWALMQMDSTLDTYDSGGDEGEAEEVLEEPGLTMPPGLLAPSVEASDLDANAGGALPTPSIAGAHPTGLSAQSALQHPHKQPQGIMMCQHQQDVTPLGGADGPSLWSGLP